MKKILALICIVFVTSGCADVSKFSLTSAPQLSTVLGQTSSLEQQLILALQTENDYLNFVSLGRYTCGDPNDKQQKVLLNAKDPATFIKRQKVNQAWQTSVDFVTAYVKALKKIANDNSAELNDVASLTAVASAAATNVPGFPPGTVAAASAFQKVADDIVTAVNNGRLAKAAEMMEPQLEAAVTNIKRYYPVFTGPEREAFRKWDACALETLEFLRDNPIDRMRAKGYPPYFGVNSGVELQAVYQTYIAQRRQFRSTPAIADLLQKIIDENRKIAQPDLNLADVQATAQSAIAIYKDGMAEINAAKNIMKPPIKKTGT